MPDRAVRPEPDGPDGYAGPAVLTVDGREVAVRVRLDARHEPVDGRLHWFGRLTPDGPEALPRAALTAPGAQLTLRAGARRAPARIGDLDLWGRYRVSGVGPPPYPLPEPVLDEAD